MNSRLTIAGAIGPTCFVTSLLAGPAAQQPVFRSQSELVRVYVTVRDRTGHLVTDLERADFDIRDRGARVPLASFSKAVQPIQVTMLVDMSGSLFDHSTFNQVRQGLSSFLDRFEAGDRGNVGWFSHDQIVIGPALTPDITELKRQLESEIRIQRIHPRFANLEPQQGVIGFRFRGRPLWNAIGAAARQMVTEPGRKVILVLANGNNTTHVSGYPRLREVRTLLATDEFMVYGVQGFEPRMAGPGRRDEDEVSGSFEERETTLQQIAASTGGGFLTAPFDPRKRATVGMEGVNANRNPLSLAFRSQLAGIIEELRHQYTLGFVPTKRDGKMSRIQVETKRPNTVVWARETYIAPAE